jgi:hypothetical protein
VYGPVDITVPDYQDPSPIMEKKYDMSELEIRLKSLEELLSNSVQKLTTETALAETAVSVETPPKISKEVNPGFTPIRTLSFKGRQLEVPYFLRDAFLLPQRFEKSETFLIRLGAEQQARIMSELPSNLDGLHKHVKRYSGKNDEILFEELRSFIEEKNQKEAFTRTFRRTVFLLQGRPYRCYGGTFKGSAYLSRIYWDSELIKTIKRRSN